MKILLPKVNGRSTGEKYNSTVREINEEMIYSFEQHP